jgi:DNA-binding response OmpR family regulator
MNVLVVTGDTTLRSFVRRVLEAQGCGVTCAPHSGHAVLACLTGTPFDVALIEAVLEDMSGAALADTLRRHHPELRVVFLGGAGTPPGPGIVVRPLSPRELLRELDAVTSPQAS